MDDGGVTTKDNGQKGVVTNTWVEIPRRHNVIWQQELEVYIYLVAVDFYSL
jgi:transcription elongation factor